MQGGWFFGYQLHSHNLAAQNLTGIGNCCPDFSDNSGSSLYLGAFVSIPLSQSLLLEARAGFSDIGAEFTEPLDIGPTLVIRNNPPDTVVVPARVERKLATEIPGIFIEPTLAFEPVSRLRIAGGLRATLLPSVDYDYSETLVEPANITFEDGSAVRNQSSASVDGTSSLQFSAVAGISYAIQLGSVLQVAPELRYVAGLSNIHADADWSSSHLLFGASFRFQVDAEEAPPAIRRDTLYQRDTTSLADASISRERIRLRSRDVERDTLQTPDALIYRATLVESYVRELPLAVEVPTPPIQAVIDDVEFVKPDGRSLALDDVQVEQIEFRDNLPLLPYVFFKENSADLRESRQNLISPEEARLLRIAKLSADNPLGIYPELLNILGRRMLDAPDSRIELTGCNSDIGPERNNLDLSRSRAEAVQEYLTETWGIAADRIVVKARNLPKRPSNNSIIDGQEENRRVEISTASAQLLADFSSQDFEYRALFDRLRIHLRAAAEKGVADWSLVISHQAVELARFEGSGTIDTALVWSVGGRDLARFARGMRFNFSVRDADNKQETASTTIALDFLSVQQKRAEQQRDKRIERYFLVIFDYNRADLGARNKDGILQLRDDLASRPTSIVTVHGYTDRTGTGDYNTQLAERRARLVLDMLDLPADRRTLLPVGSKVLLYDNNHPVGRFYSRTVEVLVEDTVQ